MTIRTKKEEKNSYLQSSKISTKRNTYLNQVSMSNENKDQGITLIALVVTIVVLLILAGITITFVLGENGIINMAKRAAEATNQAVQKDLDDLANITEQMQNYLNGGSGGSTGDDKPAMPENWNPEKVTAEKSKDDVVVPVPIGFTPSTIEGENTVENGFVIKQGTDGSATSGINEFVWVPVPDPSTMFTTNLDGNPAGQLYNFTANDDPTKVATPRTYPTTKSSGYREPDVVTNASSGTDSTTGTDYDAKAEYLSILGLNSATEFKTQLEQEFLAMKTSIETYQGFYIGRYETGNLSTVKAVVQKGNEDINKQTWYTMYVKSKKIAEGTKANSSMIWGCQWDACLRWFLTSKKEDVRSFVTDSTGKGNYKGTQGDTNKAIPTGSNDNYKVNNIYDMAGNVWDWTLEASYADSRGVRRRRLQQFRFQLSVFLPQYLRLSQRQLCYLRRSLHYNYVKLNTGEKIR